MPPFDMPASDAGFDARAGWVVTHLMVDLAGAKLNHAGAIVGNLGGESGLETINEKHPLIPGSRGGFGWGQWTGDRRVRWEAWCDRNGLKPTDDEANYRWLVIELQTTEKHALEQLLKTESIEAAVETFEVYYERPSRIELPHRVAFAKRAIAAALGLAHVEHFQTTNESATQPRADVSTLQADLARSLASAPGDRQIRRIFPAGRRGPGHPLHLAGGMGLGLAGADLLAWLVGPDVMGVLAGLSFSMPPTAHASLVLLLGIPGSILLHRMPWLSTQLGNS